MYKLTNDYTIFRILDNSFIPINLENTDYQQYLKWISEGNIPEPADVLPEENHVLIQIRKIESTITTRRFREAILTEEGKQWIADRDAEIARLREQL